MHNFDEMWEPNKECLRGLLISIVKDIDLADDLLQETYLRARDKIDSYHGGDSRSWLSTIAKNLAFAHWRKPYARTEVQAQDDDCNTAQIYVGTDSHIDAMLARKAIDDLSPVLRDALLLKHFGGFKYSEIAERLQCPVGTAKRRVCTAIRQLRSTLGILQEDTSMERCSEIRLMEYAYSTLFGKDREAVESHLASCDTCRSEFESIRSVLTQLDAVWDEFMVVDISDMHADGSSTTYSSSRHTNSTSDVMVSSSFNSMGYHTPKSVFYNGEEASFKQTGIAEDGCSIYEVQPKHPLSPGETAKTLIVLDTPAGIGAGVDIGFGRWAAVPDNSGSGSHDTILVQVVRLPEGAKLIGSIPTPDDIRDGCRKTLIWRRLNKTDETLERPVVIYSL